MVVLHLILLPNVTIKKGLTVEHPIAVTLQISWISKGDFLGEKEDFQLFQIDTQIKFCLLRNDSTIDDVDAKYFLKVGDLHKLNLKKLIIFFSIRIWDVFIFRWFSIFSLLVIQKSDYLWIRDQLRWKVDLILHTIPYLFRT